jgi:hypothetical protein
MNANGSLYANSQASMADNFNISVQQTTYGNMAFLISYGEPTLLLSITSAPSPYFFFFFFFFFFFLRVIRGHLNRSRTQLLT